MRKYIVGFLVGLLAASAMPAYGAVQSLIGKKVGGELSISYNGEQIGKGIIVDGRSYLPVRDTANALGLNLNVGKEGVQLSVPVDPLDQIASKNEEINGLKSQIIILNNKRDVAVRERDQLKNALSQPNKVLETARIYLDSLGADDPRRVKATSSVDQLEKQEVEDKQRLADLESEIVEYDNQIAALEAEITELQK
ncbi:hypothetical protein K0T92_14515 [Paenibacillus oenotherae]|uniref:Copper amine oxidase-like N-terminal domain-containing protein n=1 Tax=Paenibacillus oenotherae TaxID=1435645 RepID=A0ABS7D8Q0_9BACL|nr:hypothetical protein [Paenibacillus oenotherae]MBW7475956.1 hypothetical protein [Paenibacillus oenotherae]